MSGFPRCAGRSQYTRAGVLAGAVLLLSACTEHHFEPPDREAQVAEASLQFNMALFDSIDWDSEEVQARDGNVVYASYCRNCHGPLGQGGTEYAIGQGLDVPSLVEPDWRYAESRESVLRRIYTGHADGMPTWGVAGITPREIDAVTFYLLNVLRPEVLRGEEGGAQP